MKETWVEEIETFGDIKDFIRINGLKFKDEKLAIMWKIIKVLIKKIEELEEKINE